MLYYNIYNIEIHKIQKNVLLYFFLIHLPVNCANSTERSSNNNAEHKACPHTNWLNNTCKPTTINTIC